MHFDPKATDLLLLNRSTTQSTEAELSKGKLWAFLFIAVVVSLGYHVAFQEIWGRYLGNLKFFYPSERRIAFGYLNALVIPLFLLLATAWTMGLYSKTSLKWPRTAATLIAIVVAVVTMGAPWPCWSGC